jgi:hypothetical protein
MTTVDELGYLAASLVFATFCAKSIATLRLLAIASNIAFITYGLAAGLAPIVVLHAVMLPLNVMRLRQVLCTSGPQDQQTSTRRLVPVPADDMIRATLRFWEPRRLRSTP